MKTSELRIGNLVNTKLGVSKIKTLTADGDIETENGAMLTVEPIPITGEWLAKLGFRNSNGDWSIYCNHEENELENILTIKECKQFFSNKNKSKLYF